MYRLKTMASAVVLCAVLFQGLDATKTENSQLRNLTVLFQGLDVTKTQNDQLRNLIRKGNIDELQLLLKHNSVNVTDRYNRTLLHYAANYKNGRVVKILVENGANPNAQDYFGQTPLHRAAQNGHVKVVKELITKNGDISIQDRYGSTPFHSAVYGGNLSVVKTLILHGTDTDTLIKANTLIKEGIYAGISLLQWAAYHRYTEITKLLKQQAETDTYNNGKRSSSSQQTTSNGHSNNKLTSTLDFQAISSLIIFVSLLPTAR